MRFTYKLYFIIICILLINSIQAQNQVSEAQARAELERRGLNEAEVINALLDEGIVIDDINDVKNLSPAQLERMQTIIQNLEQGKKSDVTKLLISRT